MKIELDLWSIVSLVIALDVAMAVLVAILKALAFVTKKRRDRQNALEAMTDPTGRRWWARELNHLFDRASMAGRCEPSARMIVHSNVFENRGGQLAMDAADPKLPSFMFNCKLVALPGEKKEKSTA